MGRRSKSLAQRLSALKAANARNKKWHLQKNNSEKLSSLLNWSAAPAENQQGLPVRDAQESSSLPRQDQDLDSEDVSVLNSGVECKVLNTDNGNGKYFCLLCSKETTHTIQSLNNCKDEQEADFLVMFILKKMLNVPSETLVQFLTTLGHPRDWISICDHCALLVTRAFELQKIISELEMKLRNCQRKIKETIAKTFEENQLKHQSIDGATYTDSTSLQPVVVVTKSIRHYVASSSGLQLTSKSSAYVNNDNSPASSGYHDPVPGPEKTVNPCQSADSYSVDYGDDDDDLCEDGDGDPLICTQASNIILKTSNESDRTRKRGAVVGNVKEADVNGKGDAVTCNEPLNTIKNIPSGIGSSKKIVRSIRRTQRKYKKTGASSKERLYGCALCPNLKSMQLHSFVKHLVFHYDRPYKCTECNAYSSGAEVELATNSLNPQTDNHHSCTEDTLVKLDLVTEDIWDCGYCSSAFKMENERTSHEKVVHAEEKPIPSPLNCSRCSNKYRDYHEWRIHRSLEHKDLAKFGCFYCDKIFSLATKEGVDLEDLHGRLRHTKEEHGQEYNCSHLVDCKFCGVNFRLISELKDHMEKQHGVNNRNNTLSCPICYKAFRSRNSLEMHLRCVHHPVRPSPEKIICDVCPFVTIAGQWKLLEHKLLQHGIEPTDGRQIYSCSRDHCLFKCLSKNTLDLHMMKEHNAERKHKCSVCGKGFLNSSKLCCHMSIHQNSKDKPFQCEICGNSFAVKNYLYIHMRLSHQNRPFASTHKKKLSRKRKPTTSSPDPTENSSTTPFISSSSSTIS